MVIHKGRTMSANELTVTVTGFKANCLELIRKIEHGELKQITLTRRGKPVAELAPKRAAKRKSFADIYGCMRGSIEFAPDYDPFEQVITEPHDPFLGNKVSGKKRGRRSAA
jgi:antitoxin (DNA-binding transcriptional repressor) of toxin-antitoxin stability system